MTEKEGEHKLTIKHMKIVRGKKEYYGTIWQEYQIQLKSKGLEKLLRGINIFMNTEE